MGLLLMLLGISGAGKSTIESMLEKEGCTRLISHTTRAIRKEEVVKISSGMTPYYFVSKEEFFATSLVETNHYLGEYYGLSKKEVLKCCQPGIYVLVIEENGAKQVEKFIADLPIRKVKLFLDVPDQDIKQRLLKRDTSSQDVKRRLDNAQLERKTADCCDYVLQNPNGLLEETFKRVKEILKQAS